MLAISQVDIRHNYIYSRSLACSNVDILTNEH